MLPPHNLHAEAALLGACMLSRSMLMQVAGMTKAEDFYSPANGYIWGALVALAAAGEPSDVVTVGEELDRKGQLHLVGGQETLVRIMGDTPTVSSAPKHAQIIEDLALQRRLIVVAGEVSKLGYESPDAGQALDEAQRMVFDLASNRNRGESTVKLDVALNGALARLEKVSESGEAITGLSTGFVELDRLMSGLQPSALYVVGARPAMGKTSFALGVAAHAALAGQRPVMFFSLEMSGSELTDRILCSDARVDSVRLKNGRLHEAEWTKVHQATRRLKDAPLWIDDNPNVTVMEMRSKARKLKAQVGDLGLIVVDYIQLMSGRSSAENRQVEIAEISRGLKILARELEVPVLALSQLNRSLEQRADKRPMLSDLRESGSLEQDADAVFFLYRDEVYVSDSKDQGLAEVIVAKHRQGPTGTARLAFLGYCTKFVNMAMAA